METKNKILLGIAVIFLIVIGAAVVEVHAQENNTGGSGGGGTATNQTSGGSGGGGGTSTEPQQPTTQTDELLTASPSSGPIGTVVTYTIGGPAGSYKLGSSVPYKLYFNGNLIATGMAPNGYATGSFTVTKEIGAVSGINKIYLDWAGFSEEYGGTVTYRRTNYFEIPSDSTSGGGGGYATNPFSISPSSGQLGTEVFYTVGNAAGDYPYQIYFNGILVASQLPSGGYVTGSFKVTKGIGAIVGDNKITLKWSGNGEIRGTTYFTLTGGTSTGGGGGGGGTYPISVGWSRYGTVVSDDGRINCGVDSSACSAYYSRGTQVNLKAVAAINGRFNYWSGDCSGESSSCTLIVTEKGPIVNAHFSEESYLRSLDISTDKYYYTAGEQVKISAVLTGSALGKAVVAAVVYYAPYCPDGSACLAVVITDEITLSLVGGVAEACEVRGEITVCRSPQSYNYYYVGYYTPRGAGTYNIDATATVNGMSVSDSTKFEVIGIHHDFPDYDSVDLSISPEEQKTIVGEPVTYLLTITDKHKAYVCKTDPCPLYAIRPYTYNLQVFGLPYPSSFSKSYVTLSAGGSEEVKLTVYPSSTAIQQTVTAVAESVSVQQVVTEPAAPTARPYTETAERVTTKVTAQVVSILPASAPEAKPTTAVESAVAIHPEYRDETYQSSVRFTVKAYQSDNDRNSDKATGVLHVVYYRPPAPPEEPPELPEVEVVTLSFTKGWNLINLPGEYVRSEQSSTCESLTGFVYLSGRGYVKLDRIKDVIGSGFLKYFSTHSFWVYAKQSCEIKVAVSNFATYSGLELKSGWNFLGTTKDMVGETLDSIKGTCNIEKAYTFSTYANKWSRFGTDSLITNPYNGILVKASGECTLGENTILPPPLPQD